MKRYVQSAVYVVIVVGISLLAHEGSVVAQQWAVWSASHAITLHDFVMAIASLVDDLARDG